MDIVISGACSPASSDQWVAMPLPAQEPSRRDTFGDVPASPNGHVGRLRSQRAVAKPYGAGVRSASDLDHPRPRPSGRSR